MGSFRPGGLEASLALQILPILTLLSTLSVFAYLECLLELFPRWRVGCLWLCVETSLLYQGEILTSCSVHVCLWPQPPLAYGPRKVVYKRKADLGLRRVPPSCPFGKEVITSALLLPFPIAVLKDLGQTSPPSGSMLTEVHQVKTLSEFLKNHKRPFHSTIHLRQAGCNL